MVNKSCFAFLLIVSLTILACKSIMVDSNIDRSLSFVNIKIDSTSGLGSSPCEPTIAIDPSNPSTIFAGSVLNNFYLSKDAGQTWLKSKMTSPYGVYGDPVIRIDDSGNAYFAHLSNPKGRAYASDEFLDRIVIQRYDKTTSSWNGGTFPPSDQKKDHDKHWYSFDPADNSILISWTEFDKYGSKSENDKSRILFSRSSDFGNTWSPSLPISQYEGDCIDDDLTTEGAVPCVAQNGDYLVTWCRDSKIYLDVSKDKGKTWMLNDIVVANQPNGWAYDIPGINRCNGFPAIKVDKSKGKFKGQLYINWSDQRNGTNDTDIWIAKSKDNGKTWSQAIRVNDDKTKTHQFMCSMDVDPVTGYIYVLFYDRRNFLDNKTDLYLAISKDGGQSFKNVKVSDTSFLPLENGVFFALTMAKLDLYGLGKMVIVFLS
jgi:hypothetical protein